MLVALVGAVVGIIKLGVTTTLTLLLTLLPNATVGALTLGAFGGLTVTGGIADGDDRTATLFADGTPGVLWACVAFVLISVLVAAVRGFLASGRRSWADAWVTPAVLVVVTGLMAIITSVRLSSSGDLGDSSTGGLHISFLTILLAAVWGLLIEVAERLVAPLVVSLVPALPGLHARITGRDGTEPAPEPVAAPAGEQRIARIVVLSLLGGTFVVGGLIGASSIISSVVFGPEAAVEAYVSAIEDGRVSDAFALADPDLPTGERTLMTDKIYGAVKDRPTGGHITDVEKSGGSAWVTVESKQDGATVTQRLELHKQGHSFLLFDHWVLTSPEMPVVDLYSALPMDASTVLVNGTMVDMESSTTVSVLPGTYTVSLVVPKGSEDLLTSSETSFTVAWPEGSTSPRRT
ncbi:hypothetical protein [Cellulomonas soli]